MSTPQPEYRTQQEQVYQQLRQDLMDGHFLPGRAMTLRGIADELGVSPMPVREALRRLTAERALELLGNRRVAVPKMTLPKLEEIVEARVALETQAALRALPHIDKQRIKQLVAIDQGINAAIRTHDVDGYIRGNRHFHTTLYSYGSPQVIMPLIESLWLQTAPFMRLVLDRWGLGYMPDRHVQATEAIAARDPLALKLAIANDIREGIGDLGQEELEAAYQAS